MARIAINGFGRIGRNFLRTVLEDPKANKVLEIVAINVGPSNVESLAHLFKYDTLLGTFPGTVSSDATNLYIDDLTIPFIAQAQQLDWHRFQVDWVVESSGHFTTRESAQQHITAGAKRVLITAPAQNEDITIIPGVNDAEFNPLQHYIVSLGSCTTNALLPMLKVLHEAFSIVSGFMTTVHAYTNSQVLLDVERPDPRRARAAALNIIPTTTGAMKVVDNVYPTLKGAIGGIALRVPVAKVSLIDLTIVVQKTISKEAINAAFNQASSALRGIVAVSNEPLVSCDYNKNSYSVTLDALLTEVRGNLGKVFGWYDNEWGYSERLKDFLISATKKLSSQN
jgi:glyceraldehyde 3-phosphate dehydrogenase (phosphorylating)